MKLLLKDENLNTLLEKYKKELDQLYRELKYLSNNRKYNYYESCSVRLAYSYLDYIISAMQTFAMSDRGLTDKLLNQVIDIRNKATEISNFISQNFSDVWEKDYSVIEKLQNIPA